MLKLLLCLKYLSKRKVVLLSILAVALSSALLISVASLFGGFIQAIESAAVDNMGDAIVGSLGGPLKILNSEELQSRLEGIEEVEATTPVLSSHGLLLTGKGSVRRVSIWGIDPKTQSSVTAFGESLFFKNDFTASQQDELTGGYVGIGILQSPDPQSDEYDLSQAEAHISKKVVLMTGTAQSEPSQAGQPEFKRKTIPFRIADLVFSGVHEFDSQFVYLPIETLSAELYPAYANQGVIADAIQIKFKADVDISQAMEKVNQCWEDFALNFLGWRAAWLEYAKPQTAVDLQRVMISEYRKQMGMLLVIFGVVSLGVVFLISCIFYMIIITRQKDIAIIKSFGGGKGTVATIFLAFGFTVGLAGSMLGFVFGYLFTTNVNQIENWIRIAFGLKIWKSSIYMFDKIPSQVDYQAAAWICLVSIIAAVLGSLLPALVASRLNPIKILRYE